MWSLQARLLFCVIGRRSFCITSGCVSTPTISDSVHDHIHVLVITRFITAKPRSSLNLLELF